MPIDKAAIKKTPTEWQVRPNALGNSGGRRVQCPRFRVSAGSKASERMVAEGGANPCSPALELTVQLSFPLISHVACSLLFFLDLRETEEKTPKEKPNERFLAVHARAPQPRVLEALTVRPISA